MKQRLAFVLVLVALLASSCSGSSSPSSPTSPTIATPSTSRTRVGANCVDGTTSDATGSGACSSHGGVSCWRYPDGSCTNP